MLLMNAVVNELFVEYGSIDSASSDAVQVNVLAPAVAAPNSMDNAITERQHVLFHRASSC